MSALASFSLSATQLTYTENVTGNPNEVALGYPVPIPVASQTPVNGFRNYASLLARHQDIALSSNSVTSQIIGQSIEGDNIWAYILSDADAVTAENFIKEPAMLQNGGIHAREWQTPEVVTGILERFYNNQNDQGFYQYLLENSQIILIPVLNVSGFKQTQRYPNQAMYSTDQDDGANWPRDGRMRRKNMRGVDTDLATENDNLLGIDLNRNNNPYWATSPGRSSGRSASIVHHGASPASEPATQALQAAANLADGRLRFYIDTHSFTQVYFAPYTANTRRNAITDSIANKMRAVNHNRYQYGPSPAGAGIGATDEYFANTYQIPAYTLETEPGNNGGTQYGGFGVTHDGFILPEAEINRVRNELANASILGYYMQAGPPSICQIQITRVDNGSTIFLGQWQTSSETNREWQQSDNTVLESGVNYRFRVSFNKPMRWRTDGQITPYPGLTISNAPTIALEGFAADDQAYSESISVANGQWLDQPNTNNDGFLNYKDDSYMFEFNLPDTSLTFDAKLFQLAIQVTDLANQQLDASPVTVVDWSNGAWSGYESTDGSLGDSGGIDRNIRLINDGSDAFNDPTAVSPPTTPPPPQKGGGGSETIWGIMILILVRLINLKINLNR